MTTFRSGWRRGQPACPPSCLPRETADVALAGGGPCTLSLDSSGRFLLAQTAGAAGTTMLQLFDLATGTLTSLPTQDISSQSGPVTW